MAKTRHSKNGRAKPPQHTFKQRFTVEPRTGHISFEGTEYDGLEIYVHLDMTLEQFFHYRTMTEDNTGEDRLRDLIQVFGDEKIVAWNVDNGDEPVPPSGEYLLKMLPISMSVAIITRWLNEVANVPTPLDPESPNGEPTELGLTALGESSKSLAS